MVHVRPAGLARGMGTGWHACDKLDELGTWGQDGACDKLDQLGVWGQDGARVTNWIS